MMEYVQILESERIRYVQVSEALVGDYLTMVNDMDRVARFIGDRTEPLTPEQEIKWVRKKIEEKAPLYSMIEKGSEKFIGNIELMHAADGAAELGISITADMQEKGYGKEAIRTVTRYAERALGLKRIYLKVFVDNARAIHVYEACGFEEVERTEREIVMALPQA